ncbi:MAG: glycoside hydrolase family 2, partial [Bacteroidales bacterium]|nr:glycoside hydrolase family 2 [Bacteroidales bacterium]
GIITEVEVISEISGSSCVKMLGPYAYTPPIYWFTNKHLGGAYGFNTETCPGANVPPLESIKKMIPADHLWPVDDVWEYHCGKNDFKTLDRITKAIDERYGKASGVADFAFKAQLLNYELMRPMFEAFQVNKSIATGVVQWMLNSALPNMYWQLYDSYLMPNGAFYATKKACEPLHLLYDYGSQSIHLINDHFYDIVNHQAQIRILDINSTEVFNKVVEIGCTAESSSLILNLPDLKNITPTYFLDLRLIDQHKNQIGNNFYWLSTTQDVLDYEAEFEDWPFYTPTSEYADYKQLNNLKPVRLNTKFQVVLLNDTLKLEVEISNPEEKLAFFIDLNISGEKSGNTVLPVFWDDNYFSLLPGETRKIKVSVPIKYLKNDKPVLKVSGWNIEEQKFKLK